MKRNEKVARVFAVLAATLLVALASGCAWITKTGDLRTETETVELDGAEQAEVHLRMGAGQLDLSGGAEGAMLAEATFTYNVPDWKPTIDYVVAGDEGELWIEQPEAETLGLDSYRYAWDVQLNQEVPMQLDVGLGAGESQIDVSTLSVSELDLNVGVGGVELDLTGDRAEDVDVIVRGGVGEATVLLPSEVGVEARVGGGLGDLNVSGLTQQGDVYVNQAYGTSEATIRLDIEGGIGGVTLRVVE